MHLVAAPVLGPSKSVFDTKFNGIAVNMHEKTIIKQTKTTNKKHEINDYSTSLNLILF